MHREEELHLCYLQGSPLSKAAQAKVSRQRRASHERGGHRTAQQNTSAESGWNLEFHLERSRPPPSPGRSSPKDEHFQIFPYIVHILSPLPLQPAHEHKAPKA